jgi:hypothetical protein
LCQIPLTSAAARFLAVITGSHPVQTIPFGHQALAFLAKALPATEVLAIEGLN